MDRYNLVSFVGLFLLMAAAWLVSSDRRRLNWHVIAWGLVLQLAFGAVIFLLPAARDVFVRLNNLVFRALSVVVEGSYFVFGRLGLPPGTTKNGEESLGFVLAFQALPTIIFFSALMSVLYYLKIMPIVIRGFAWVFTRLMRVSGAESLCAASNIFVGVESALVIRPHIEKMTRSELCTVLTAGMATIASSVLGFYAFVLRDTFPLIGGHLISASILSAPAALVMSKIVCPETGEPETLGVNVECHYQRENGLFEAIINGANAGLKLVGGIIALLIAILGLVALVNLVLVGIGWRLNAFLGISVDWTLQGLLGYIFYPFTLIIGVPIEDAAAVSKIIGGRTILTELVGYGHLADLLNDGSLCFPGRSAILTTYALCGFAHVASIGIFVGGAAALAPSKAGDLAKVAGRALIAATLACLMTACVAGVFLHGDSSILLGTI